MTRRKGRGAARKWYAVDLHLHTPASSDYQQPNVSYLDILRRAEERRLDMIAFTDHNTLAGYRQMMAEVESLALLQELKRILPEEEARLKEYQRLFNKIVVLPGFEFTATFGFHILGIFPPDKPVREIEYLLLKLNVPSDQLDEGTAAIGASADVLRAYEVINQAGGMAIAAHANSSNGVAMREFNFGGQTKIAYTQDANLIALEVTDLETRSRRTTAHFFSGAKPEYPRRMHCIQGSDAHRLAADAQRRKNLGVGDRVTEMLLPEASFKAVQDLFKSNDFARTRPRQKQKEQVDFDFVQAAREDGSNIVQDFHESMTVRGGKLYAIIADVCAFANTNGGTIYIGVSSDLKDPVPGMNKTNQAIQQLEKEISNRISPPLHCTVDTQKTNGKDVLRVLVPRGDDPPYAVDDNKIYVRDEAETGLAVRDEIVGLVTRSQSFARGPQAEAPVSLIPDFELERTDPAVEPQPEDEQGIEPPRTGVQVAGATERKGMTYYRVIDLRNGNEVNNVTTKSARRLWHYAIVNYSELDKSLKKEQVQWQGDIGVLKSYKRGKSQAYDLVQRDKKKIQFYFGVTEDGIHGEWRTLVGLEDNGE